MSFKYTTGILIDLLDSQATVSIKLRAHEGDRKDAGRPQQAGLDKKQKLATYLHHRGFNRPQAFLK